MPRNISRSRISLIDAIESSFSFRARGIASDVSIFGNNKSEQGKATKAQGGCYLDGWIAVRYGREPISMIYHSIRWLLRAVSLFIRYTSVLLYLCIARGHGPHAGNKVPSARPRMK